jgi:hypothetical protein
LEAEIEAEMKVIKKAYEPVTDDSGREEDNLIQLSNNDEDIFNNKDEFNQVKIVN